jgi:hypothetical protein
MVIFLSICYLLQFIYCKKQKLIPNNYYDWKISMIYFIKANGHHINMHANIQGMNMYALGYGSCSGAAVLRAAMGAATCTGDDEAVKAQEGGAK